MHSNFGYFEEEHLGKPYDMKLLRRIYRYIRPYRKWFFLSILLALLTAAVDLSFPYIVKEAIDLYIVQTYHPVFEKKGVSGMPRSFAPDLIKTADPVVRMMSNSAFKKIDPGIRDKLIRSSVIGKASYVRLFPDGETIKGLRKQTVLIYQSGKALFIPYSAVREIPYGQLLRLRAGNLRGVARMAFLYLTILMAGFFMQFFEVIALETMGQRVMQDIRVELFNHILRLKAPFFDTSPVGRVVTRVTNDIENLHNLFTAILVNQFKDVFLLMGILAVLFNIQYRLALLVLILVPFIVLVSFLFSRWARDVFRDIRALIGQINATVQETLSGIRVLQVFQQEHRRAETFKKINSRTYEANIRQVKIFAFFMPLIEVIGSFAVALIIWRGGIGIIGGALSLGALVAFLSYIRMFFRPIRDLAEKYNIMQSAMASTERIFQLMDMEREAGEERDPSSPEPDVRFAKEFEKDIAFSHVWFRYGEDKWVFKDLSITFEARKTTAVVGPTGAGKSSMIYLLDRFYHPEKGGISIGSRNIRRISLNILRKNIGFVLQDVRLFSGTLWENILLGAAEKDRMYAAEVLDRLGIPDFSDRFQEGLETRLGEEGRGMSSGERQIIAFARAFAINPPILVLDEATASVDPLTERLIQQALHALLKGRTAIVIAHRLSTIRQADRIVVIQDGYVVESGTHASLIEDRGLYARYHRIQEE